MQKRNLAPAWISFDPDNVSDDALENVDPDSITGVLSIRFNEGGQVYRWTEVTYQEYLDFESAGFDTGWVNENLAIFPPGGWGWNYGRTVQTGWAAES